MAITTNKLKGHKAAVLCLDISSPHPLSTTSTAVQSSISSTASLLLSGSEDGTARIWDLREHKRRACLCIQTIDGGDVLSAVFAPPSLETTTMIGEESRFARDYTVYLSVDNIVLEYDLRKATSPVLVEPRKNWGPVLQNQDEVNQIGLAYFDETNYKNMNTRNNRGGIKNSKRRTNKKRGKQRGEGNQQWKSNNDDNGDNDDTFRSCTRSSLYIAACDDAGTIRCCTSDIDTNCNNGPNNKTTVLHHDENGVAVITACAFRPNKINHTTTTKIRNNRRQQLELVSCGTDCRIKLWDIHRSKKPLSIVTIDNNSINHEEKKPQVCNPPFVYSLAWSKSGEKLAGGLGDGTIGIFEINNRTLIQTNGIQCAHESSVASVVFPSFSSATGDRILCSAGTDGQIVLWDLGISNDEQWIDDDESVNLDGSDRICTTTDVVDQLFDRILLQQLNNYDHNNNTVDTTIPTNDTMIASKKRIDYEPSVLFKISHGKKINWVTPAAPSSEAASSAYNDTVFVADTSSDITSYTIPF